MFNIDKYKEIVSGIKFKLSAFLTPINYLEYVFKMMLILHTERVKILFYTDIFLHIVFILIKVLTPSPTISLVGLFFSLVISALFLGLFTFYRISYKKNSNLDYVDGGIKFKDIQFEKIERPVNLSNFIKMITNTKNHNKESQTQTQQQTKKGNDNNDSNN